MALSLCRMISAASGFAGGIITCGIFAVSACAQIPNQAVVTNTPVNHCNDPHPSVSTFQPTDTSAVVFFSFSSAPSGSMSLSWFGPGKVLYTSGSWSNINQYTCFQSSLLIAGTAAATMTGNWAVQVNLNGSTIVNIAFIIGLPVTGPQQTVGYPVTNPHVIANCSFRDQCVGSAGDEHTGIDFTGSDSNILAAADGTVVIMQQNGVGCTCSHAGCGCQDHGLGNAIVLQHKGTDGSTFYSLYGHNASFAPGLAIGNQVHKGDHIAIMGGTGYGLSDAWITHCHFEVKASPPRLGNPSGQEMYFGYTHDLQDPASYGYFDPATYIASVGVTTLSACVGCGAPSSAISAIFLNAYNLEPGNLGAPAGVVIAYTDTFYSPAISGYYQTFADSEGKTASLHLLSGAANAYSVKWGFSDLHSQVASYQSESWHVYDLVVAPTANEAPANSASAAGTNYTWQPFLKGSMYFFNMNGFAPIGWAGKSEYVWAEFSQRYEREGGRMGQLGLPISEAWDDGSVSGINWWCQWFERGYICRGTDTTATVYTIASASSSNLLDQNGNWNPGTWTDLGWVQY